MPDMGKGLCNNMQNTNATLEERDVVIPDMAEVMRCPVARLEPALPAPWGHLVVSIVFKEAAVA